MKNNDKLKVKLLYKILKTLYNINALFVPVAQSDRATAF